MTHATNPLTDTQLCNLPINTMQQHIYTESFLMNTCILALWRDTLAQTLWWWWLVSQHLHECPQLSLHLWPPVLGVDCVYSGSFWAVGLRLCAIYIVWLMKIITLENARFNSVDQFRGIKWENIEKTRRKCWKYSKLRSFYVLTKLGT